jgi:two-component system sensor histidine kinase TctE
MSPRTEVAPSIRRRLLLFLLPPLALLMLASVFANYRAAMIFVRDAYDQRLGNAAMALAARVAVVGHQISVDGSHADASAPHADRPGPVYYSLLAPGARLLDGNPQLPVAPPGRTNPSYADARLGATELRIATYRLRTAEGIVTITAAETAEARSASGHFILASTWLVDFVQLDVILLIVWIGIHYGLRPLAAVRSQIEAQPARELRPLDLASVPAEVRPLVDALNLLFDMLREAGRSQRQFVADTAHQLRTPIAGLMGHLELLMRDPAAAAVSVRLAALHEGMSRLAHSANQLLALARADPSASLTEQFELLELRALVERVVELNIDRAAEGGLDLGAEAAPAAVAGSTRLLEDLLGNLVDNALSYTPSGGHVTARSGVANGEPYLEVEDDGPGIPEAERARVRQRFYRMPGTAGAGCGLGLAIVDEISRLHGGTLTIECGASGTGTRVRVQFPKPAMLEGRLVRLPERRRKTESGVSV